MSSCAQQITRSSDSKRSIASVETGFNVPSGAKAEVCEYPSFGYADLEYDSKVYESLEKLCDMDFYGLTPDKNTYAICPKVNSTNPGTNVFKIPPGKTQSDLIALNCRGHKKKAKYKQSISCSYYPSMIGYFHLSQVIGIGMVPESVYRTMDRREHKKITARGIKYTKNGTLINTLWKQYRSWENKSDEQIKSSSKYIRLYTDDLSQLAGALNKNPTGEERYREIMGTFDGERKCNSKERATCFMKNPASGFPKVASSSLLNLSDYSFQERVALIQKLKDITGMVIMDHIMNQQDRFGNQHYYPYYFVKVNGKIKKYPARKYILNQASKTLTHKSKGKVVSFSDVAKVKVLLMKDNDCGVIKSNVMKRNGVVSEINHLNYKTYQKLLFWQESLSSQENVSYLKRHAHLTSADISSIKKNTNEVVGILKAKCESGALKFDLSQKLHDQGKVYQASDFNCELEQN